MRDIAEIGNKFRRISKHLLTDQMQGLTHL